jgi:hypothetical protein
LKKYIYVFCKQIILGITNSRSTDLGGLLLGNDQPDRHSDSKEDSYEDLPS